MSARLVGGLCLVTLALLCVACGPTPVTELPPLPTPTATPRPAKVLVTQPTGTASPTRTQSASATATATPTAGAHTPTPVPPTLTADPGTLTPALPTGTPVLETRTPALPTLTPVPATLTPDPRPLTPVVTVRLVPIAIPAYPYDQFVTTANAPDYNMTYPRLNWDAYAAVTKQATARTFTAIILENEYLRLSILPELGGRIYEAIFKPTGHNMFYRNPVLKPTRWGHETQGWWLAVGGMEWCLPVEEHGYEWGQPWSYSIDQGNGQASVTVWDTQASDRLRARVTITLSAGRSYFTVAPRIENPTSKPVPYQFWLNAMLASGGTNHVGDATEFIFPVSQVTIHSTGDRTLPQDRQAMSWPVFNGRVLNLYGTWKFYLGLFARPQAQRGFMGAYDHASGEGVLRVFPPDVATGAKLFAGKGLDPALWTDDGSSYFEIHGGVTPTFWDVATLAPGASIGWSERWYPYTQIGAVSEANDEAALSLQPVQGGYRLGVAVTSVLKGRLVLSASGKEVWAQNVALSPDHPFGQTVTTIADGVSLRLEDEQGRVIVAADGSGR